jgi:hypothetical protein
MAEVLDTATTGLEHHAAGERASCAGPPGPNGGYFNAS